MITCPACGQGPMSREECKEAEDKMSGPSADMKLFAACLKVSMEMKVRGYIEIETLRMVRDAIAKFEEKG